MTFLEKKKQDTDSNFDRPFSHGFLSYKKTIMTQSTLQRIFKSTYLCRFFLMRV